MDRHPVTRTLLIGLALTVVACGPSAVPTPSDEPSTSIPSPRASPTRALATDRPSPDPSPTPEPLKPFTILLLGADHDGRTDAMMVVGVDPIAERVTYASIPRDTVNVPLPDGTTFRNRKINEFHSYAGSHASAYPAGPGRATADMIGSLLAVRIDYYAFTTFAGFSALVDATGGVAIDLPDVVRDDFLQVGPNSFGITFPKGQQSLDGRKALIFVRIRHLDSDFARQRRQQQLVTAAGLQIIRQPALLDLLVVAARGHLRTDFPLDQASRYSVAMSGLDAADIEGVVLGPRRYEHLADCPCGYALEPDLAPIRSKAAELFPWAVGD